MTGKGQHDTDVPHGSQRPPPNRAPTAGVWRQGVRPFRNLPTPEPHSGLCCVSPGDPATPGSLARRWRTAHKAAFRLGPAAQSPPGPFYVTSDRDAPAARPGPSRHRPARGSHTSFPSPCMEREMPAGQRVRSQHLSTLNQFSSQTGACTPRPRPGSIPFEPQPITPSRRDRRARDPDNIPGEIHPQSSHQRFNIPAKIRPRTSNQRFNIPAKIRPLSPRQKSSIPGDLTPNLAPEPRNLSHSFNPKPPKQNRIPPWHKQRFPSLLQPVSRWHTQKPKIKVKKASNFSGSIGTSANGHPHIPGLGQIHSSLDGFVPRVGPRHGGLCLVEIPPRG